MASGGIGNQSPATIFQARLFTELGGGVTDILQLLEYQGNKVVVNGMTVVIPGSGVGLQRDVADNLIDAAGADAGAAGSANTLYYVYVSNSRASFSPESIRLSASSPSLKSGVKYLGLSGNAANWRFVGWARLNATPQFESSDQNALIANYYNRRQKYIFNAPGYDDTTEFVTFSQPANATYEPANGGVDNSVTFIGNGEDPVDMEAHADVTPQGVATGDVNMGLGLDSTTGTVVSSETVFNGGASWSFKTPKYAPTPAEGYRVLNLLFAVTGGACTVYSTFRKYGSPVQPYITIVAALVWV